MSRILGALQQIQAKSPQTPRGIRPVSPEELEAFGLRPPAPPEGQQPAQTAPSPAVETVEPAQAADASEPVEQTPPPAAAHADAPEAEASSAVSQAAEPAHEVARALSPLAEEPKRQYRQLADNVLGRLASAGAAALMFTSPGEGEGKTSTLVSLAAVLAEMVPDEIVAVDANFHNPALAERFGVRAAGGLADVLTGAATWRDVVRKTSVPRLSVMPAGEAAASLQTDQLHPVLDALRSHYRFVLLDAASLFYPEVAPLSRLCEGTCLVVELGRTPRRAARQAVRLIEHCGGRVLGCVLTNAPPQS